MIEINFPEKFQQLFIPHRYKIFHGGRGGGKSYSFAQTLVVKAHTSALRILCTREFQSSIQDSVHRLIADQITQMGLLPYFNITNNTITSTAGSQFIFKGLRHSIQEIKSTEGIDICWIEEAQAISETSWEILIPTIRKENSEIWISFNPQNESDPTFQRFIINTPPDSVVEQVNWSDNPYFPKTLDAERRYMLGIDTEAYTHVWEGACKKLSDAVIFRNRVSVETFEEPPEHTRFYYGLDFGFANSPTAANRCWIHGKTLYIDYEAWGVGVEIDDTPAFLDTIPGIRNWTIKADAARPETISHLKRKGFKIVAAKKWPGSVEDGLTVLKGFEKIVIHERCTHTAEDFRLYSYKVDKQTNEILPLIIKRHDDTIDDLRYALSEIIRAGNFFDESDFG